MFEFRHHCHIHRRAMAGCSLQNRAKTMQESLAALPLNILMQSWDIWYLRISLNVLLASLRVECASCKDCPAGTTGSTRNAGSKWSKSADAMERPSCRERATGPTHGHSSSLSSASWTQKVTKIPIMSTARNKMPTNIHTNPFYRTSQDTAKALRVVFCSIGSMNTMSERKSLLHTWALATPWVADTTALARRCEGTWDVALFIQLFARSGRTPTWECSHLMPASSRRSTTRATCPLLNQRAGVAQGGRNC